MSSLSLERNTSTILNPEVRSSKFLLHLKLETNSSIVLPSGCPTLGCALTGVLSCKCREAKAQLIPDPTQRSKREPDMHPRIATVYRSGFKRNSSKKRKSLFGGIYFKFRPLKILLNNHDNSLQAADPKMNKIMWLRSLLKCYYIPEYAH